ncbi:phosphoenolpyruvate-protein phosphotransferase [Cnuibacter physcomitrellae]|uniref:Phosphoenolpyruvate-protein phosphotransferase n=1 Tax=Cnuibacter physcomitrellae TaxID=1619308 RepID=A0A1X9LNB9_9MICO|nr:phosphoenolpyruvate--protein phosphotransferase [Cnuibacter physcomitrellae]ARJ04619.1 phosphoenolpyruvate--protein phosphotransferase [Cnuibacter physcomitrellae]GGI42277.1 phosphoenolpyruvate-protein phosphotransferase [Cnuibacter physcomitrellae]
MSGDEVTSTLTGTGIGRGIAVGTVLRMPDPLPEPEATPSTLGPDAEKERARASLAATAAVIRHRGERAGGSAKDVLEAQAFMAEDPTLADDVAARIDGGSTAERAVFDAFAAFRDLLVSMGGYMGERATDLDDVSQRVVAHLRGVPAPGVPESDTPFVLVARDLAPADTALLDLEKVLALVTSEGGPTSHTAILAREKAIIAVVGVAGALSLADGTEVIVDAATGRVTLSPSDDERASAVDRAAADRAAASAPVGPGALADGTAVPLLANLGSSKGAADAVAKGAEGVGLFRTEFLFLDAETAPSVADQTAQYTALLEAFPGRKVVVRALDAGADKPLSFLNDSAEENPALGLRGLRALRANESVLRDQLTALAAADAATEADLWVMAPMVSTVEETRYFTQLARELGLKTAGVMVEVPSSALLADRILAVADFASIGTNDLTQYTLAADRLLGSVASFQDPWHPAVLKLVGEVGRAGAELGKPVGICGEAAADPLLAVVLVGLGATTLSMSPAALADVRSELARHTLDEARRFAALALSESSAVEARAAVTSAAAGT